jgi:hypothetical protein
MAIAVIALLLPLVGYAYTGTFMRFSGDDFCYAAELYQHGFWDTQWDSYTSVTNYSGNCYALTLHSGLSGLFGPRCAGVLPAMAIALWLGGAVYALGSHPRLDGRRGLGLDLALTAATGTTTAPSAIATWGASAPAFPGGTTRRLRKKGYAEESTRARPPIRLGLK